MTERSDAELLESWSAEGSERAFAELARRYGGLLYHSTLRRTGRADLAQEAAQNALLILARKAKRLGQVPSLAGWLHRTVCYEAAKLLRRERRHDARMKRFHLHHDPADASAPWQEVALVLDQALDALPERDRQVIFAKYFDGLNFEQIARRFGGEPAAWRQRGSRAIERLRGTLAKRGVTVSAIALSSGLGTSLGQAAPPAILASLGSSPAAAAATLSWQTLALHSIHLMKVKPAVAVAAVLLVTLIPLGLQAHAIADARSRTNLLESAIAQHESAASSLQARQPGGMSTRVNLVALADALLAAEQGDYAKRFSTERQVNAMDSDELERLLLEAANLEMGADQRNALVSALFKQFCELAKKSGMPCERVLDLAARLGPQMGARQGNIWLKAHANIRDWIDSDPDAAAAWFQATWKSGPSGEPAIKALLGLAFDALHRHNPADAIEFFRSLPDFERHNVIGMGGGRANPETMVTLAAEIGDPGLRGSALSQAFGNSDGKSAGKVRAWLDGIHPSQDEAMPLLVAAASRPLGDATAETILGRLDWLREASAGLDSSRAAGEFFAQLARINPVTSREALDAEWQRNPDEQMVAAYLCTSFYSKEAVIVDAVPLAQLITDPTLRDDSLRRMLTGTRSDEAARTLARKGGMSEPEIDRLIPTKP